MAILKLADLPIIQPSQTEIASIIVIFKNGAHQTIGVGTAAQIPATRFIERFSPKQRLILTSLLRAGPAKGETLAKRTGYANASTLYQGGRGINQLRENGLLIITEDGYQLTETGINEAEQLASEE